MEATFFVILVNLIRFNWCNVVSLHRLKDTILRGSWVAKCDEISNDID